MNLSRIRKYTCGGIQKGGGWMKNKCNRVWWREKQRAKRKKEAFRQCHWNERNIHSASTERISGGQEERQTGEGREVREWQEGQREKERKKTRLAWRVSMALPRVSVDLWQPIRCNIHGQDYHLIHKSVSSSLAGFSLGLSFHSGRLSGLVLCSGQLPPEQA